MKLKSIMMLGAALMVGTVGAAPAKKSKASDTPKKPEHSVLYHAARMLIAGSLCFVVADVAIKGFDKLMPYGAFPIGDAQPNAKGVFDQKDSYLGGYGSKVLFPIAGAVGLWLYCYLTNQGKSCDEQANDAGVMAGLPKKDVAEEAAPDVSGGSVPAGCGCPCHA